MKGKILLFIVPIYLVFNISILYAKDNDLGNYVRSIKQGDVYTYKNEESGLTKLIVYNEKTKFMTVIIGQKELGNVSVQAYDVKNSKYYTAFTMKKQMVCNVQVKNIKDEKSKIDRYVIPSELCQKLSEEKDISYLIKKPNAKDFQKKFDKVDKLIRDSIMDTKKLKEHTIIDSQKYTGFKHKQYDSKK